MPQPDPRPTPPILRWPARPQNHSLPLPCPRRTPSPRLAARRSARLVAGCLAVAILTACDGSPREPSRPSVSAPQQDARGSAEELALAAYRGMWQAYRKAGLAADPDEPDLHRYASGRALSTLQGALAAARRDGHVIKGELGLDPRIETVSPSTQPTTIGVIDCLNTESFLTYTTSGDPVDDEPGGRRLTRATVTNLGTDGGWKVTGLGIQAVGTCS